MLGIMVTWLFAYSTNQKVFGTWIDVHHVYK